MVKLRVSKKYFRFGLLASLLSLSTFLFAALKPGDFVTSGPTSQKRIALTFDDGPGPNTAKFLALLDKYHVKATFFMQGTQVKLRPQVAKEIEIGGHEIANHTWQHLNYKKHLKKIRKKDEKGAEARAREDLAADMKKTLALIEKSTGKKPVLCRMPHGIDGPWIHLAAKEAGQVLVNWTYGADWDSKPVEKLLPGYLKAIKPGAIILLHDGWPKSDKSLAITEALLKEGKEKGYEFVTAGELLGLKN